MKTCARLVGLMLVLGGVLTLASCQKQDRARNRFERWVDRQFAPPEARDGALYVTAEREGRKASEFIVDFANVQRPASPGVFTQLFHLPPVEQHKTGTCWSFGTTSLLESELRRLGRREVKLSELHTVYWEYVEKARRYVREKGESFLGQGSEPNSAIERMKRYGVVRASDYSGLPAGRTEHDHTRLFEEFRAYLESCRAKEDWNEAKALAGVRAILDRHLGRPPERITVDGRSLSPQDYLAQVLKLKLEDYVCFTSFMYLPFYGKGEYRVPDNWWHSADYYNIPLHEFYLAILRALRRGFTIVLAVDFSEPGNRGEENTAIVPTFDIPSAFLDQPARELRFVNKTSTDDHVVHAVGYKEAEKGTAWLLVKDSWETAYRGPHKGYFFYRDDYVRLKVLMFMTHRDAVKEFLQKFEPAK
ncbi:MAG: peptidase C1 [Candidatus Aminicenantes bacterium]|nr:peptidase C1 [Candidatus Aminicenantes bacterium]